MSDTTTWDRGQWRRCQHTLGFHSVKEVWVKILVLPICAVYRKIEGKACKLGGV